MEREQPGMPGETTGDPRVGRTRVPSDPSTPRWEKDNDGRQPSAPPTLTDERARCAAPPRTRRDPTTPRVVVERTPTGEEAAQDEPPDAAAHEQDRELYHRLCQLLERCEDAVRIAQDYEGCGGIIRQSMSVPSDVEMQRAASLALLPNVAGVRMFFELSQEMKQTTPVLLRRLAELDSVVERPSLTGKLAELLQAVLEWDLLKMMRPQIQNDFASYRRQLPRMKAEHEKGHLPELPVLDTDANAISMFIAENLPFTVVLARATAESAKQAPRVANVIATVANMCCGMVQRRLYSDDATNRKLLMAMTSAAVLYDRITDSGVFVKRSGVGVSKCIKALNKHGGATGEQLRACLRYSTMHYNSDTTPRYIRNALAS